MYSSYYIYIYIYIYIYNSIKGENFVPSNFGLPLSPSSLLPRAQEYD